MININKWEKEVLASLLDSEEETLKELQKQYDRALRDIGQKVKAFQSEINMLDAALQSEGLDDKAKEVLLSQRRSKVYQKQFQEALQGQISGILDQMQGNNYSTIESYLKQTYEDAYIGTMYDLQGQGIPIIAPIDQAAAVKAVMTDSKISNGLYTALGVDVKKLKKSISAEITRGIASSLPYADIARNLNNVSKAGLSNATRIVRTEGHRIQQASTMDAQRTAKAKGADVVKQWDAALDGRTRPTHRQLDGQIREVDEFFEVAGKKAMAPGYFGDPAEDCNCRCACLTRARWALNDDELSTLRERAKFFGIDKSKDFEAFKDKYLKAEKKIQTGGQVKDFWQRQEVKDKQAAKEYDRIKKADDIAAIALSSGMSKEDVVTIKNHVFFDVHELYDGKGTFAPSYDMAVAWKRLVEGVPEERDLLLLQHELLESHEEKKYNLTASEAHAKAKKKYNWEQAIFDLFGEEGEPDGLL